MEITARYFSGVSFLFAEGGDRAVIGKRDTKAIGDMSELEAARALARAGYLVSKPLGDSHRYDLIIDDGTVLSRVQVKTGRLRKGAIIFACFSSHSHRGGPSCRPFLMAAPYPPPGSRRASYRAKPSFWKGRISQGRLANRSVRCPVWVDFVAKVG